MGEVGCLSLEKLGQYPGLNFSSATPLLELSEEEKWNLAKALHTLGVVVLSIVSWFTRILLVFVPQGIPLYGLSSALGNFSSISMGGQDHQLKPSESELEQVNVPISGGPIGRALLQILALVNDLPASSTKYTFARTLAEKIIQENATHGHGYESVNRAALSAGFERTLVLLNRSLEGIHQQRSSGGDFWRLPGRLLRMIPSGGFNLALPPPLSLVRTQIGHFIPPLSRMISSTTMFSNSGDTFSGPALSASSVGNIEMAEKLAQELLWLAEKLAEISALDEGIVQWSSSSSLAAISLRSSPHVQRALVRLSALFVKELVKRNYEVGRDVQFKLLLRWLPLFCAATHGGDGPIFTISERIDLENSLDKVIKALPESDQEVILAIWLQEFALSSSDWPNLQPSYDYWCNTTRKLRHAGGSIETL
ncbi:unnamed protein product [Calypogeia fissa]